jgi:hypothetical protein
MKSLTTLSLPDPQPGSPASLRTGPSPLSIHRCVSSLSRCQSATYEVLTPPPNCTWITAVSFYRSHSLPLALYIPHSKQ